MSENAMYCVNALIVCAALVGLSFFARGCHRQESIRVVQHYCVERGNPAADCAKLGLGAK